MSGASRSKASRVGSPTAHTEDLEHRVPAWRATTCKVAGWNMTEAEWQQHVPSDEPCRATCPELPVSR